jgi:hypothetical protein
MVFTDKRYVNGYFQILEKFLINRAGTIEVKSAIAYRIDAITKPRDYVLVWGNEVAINFLSHRDAPTKYTYQYPIFLNNYSDEGKIASFLNDLKIKPPEIIVEPMVDSDEIFPLARRKRDLLLVAKSLPDGAAKIFDYIDSHYCLIAVYHDINVYGYEESVAHHYDCLSEE